jgi:hypothetical protein
MEEWRWIAELAKNNGLGVLLFVALFFFQKYQAKAARQQLQANAEREKQNFELLKGFLDTLQCQIAQLARIENKIDSHQYCPMVRKEIGQ